MRLPETRKSRLWLSSTAGVALVVAAVVLLNVAGQYVYGRLDLSAGRLYSLSPASRRILRALPDPVLVKVYHSRELPPQIAVSYRYLRDLLEEYRSGSDGKVRPRFVAVGSDMKEQRAAVEDGVTPVQFDILSQEKYEAREGFLGVVLQYENKKSVIPYLQGTDGLEYELTSRIKTLSETRRPVLGFATGAFRPAVNAEGLSQDVRARLAQRYDLRDVDLDALGAGGGVPKDVDALLLVGPRAPTTQKEQWALDQFLLRGGALGVALDTKRVNLGSFVATALNTGLRPFLAAHGMTVEPTLVLDAQSQPVQVSMRRGMFMVSNIVQYPPMVLSNALDADDPITKGLRALLLPFVSPVVPSTGPAFGTVAVLARSSRYSWAPPPAQASFLQLNPYALPKPQSSDLKGPFPLAATRIGDFKAFFPAPPKGVKAKLYLKKASAKGRLAVVGTSTPFRPDYRGQGTGGVFVLNLADWLEQDTDLIAIRSKTVKFSPLKAVSAPVKRAVRWTDILLPPLLAILFGLEIWRRRAKAARRAAAALGPREPAPAPDPESAAV
jgi:gliding motility-associatede transport system auxiliary component